MCVRWWLCYPSDGATIMIMYGSQVVVVPRSRSQHGISFTNVDKDILNC